jgi:predicted dehydrogenase
MLEAMSNPLAPVRIGVIGFGQWGPNHVRNFSQQEGCELVRVCDSSDARLKAAQKFLRGVAVTTDPAQVTQAADIDAVIVATPTSTHYALVKAALAAGKDVLCEKPLAQTAAECRELAELAVKQGRILMVGHVFLYNPGVLHLKTDLDRGELGRVYYMDAVRTNLGPVRKDVGAIYDLASHDISIFNFLLGTPPVEVSATGQSVLLSGIEDVAFLTLHYPGNIVCHAHTSWLNPRKVRQLTIVGDQKMALWDDMNNLEPIRYYDKGVMADHYTSFGEFQLILRDGQILIPKVKMFEPLAKQDLEFVACIRSRRAPLSDAWFGLAVVQVMEAAMESLRNQGRTTKVAGA